MMKMTLFLLILTFSNAANAREATYFRVWEGFKKSSLTQDEFLQAIPQFMKDTVDIYQDRALVNYIVTIPPISKPAFIPDELALVALTSQQDYQDIRKTPVGQKYSDRHWDVFEKTVSKSASEMTLFDAASPIEADKTYINNNTPFDWSNGHARVFIGTIKETRDPYNAIKDHLKALNQLPGLNSWIASIHEQYVVIYTHWTGISQYNSWRDSEDYNLFRNARNLIFTTITDESAVYMTAGLPIISGGVYSTVVNPEYFKSALDEKVLSLRNLIDPNKAAIAADYELEGDNWTAMIRNYLKSFHDFLSDEEFDLQYDLEENYVGSLTERDGDKSKAGTITYTTFTENMQHAFDSWICSYSPYSELSETQQREVWKLISQLALQINQDHQIIYGFDTLGSNGCGDSTAYIILFDTQSKYAYGLDLYSCKE